MKIGELSQRTGVSVRMLRYYEQQGLLAPQRRDSGYRDYDSHDERVVQRIVAFNQAGLKLESIKALLPCVINDHLTFTPCAALRALLRQELDGLDHKIAHLQSSRDLLARHLNGLDVGV